MRGAHQWMIRVQESRRRRPLTLFGKSATLIGSEILLNALAWTVAGICLPRSGGILGLALLAWTIGLRHGLDADHISAIDNATRHLVSLGQLPITCGLFFSLGHSTIVIVVNVAIAISVDIYDKLDKVGSVGGVIGASISASFLFLIACINTYFLVKAIKARKRLLGRLANPVAPDGGTQVEEDETKIHGGGCLVRIIGLVLRAVDRPWKMYPVGILFGFGFDTASSIALLAISAVAQNGKDGQSVSHGKIVILPLLFTAGMTLVDSLDSVLMLYAYAAPTSDSEMLKTSLFADTEDDKDSIVSPPLHTEGDLPVAATAHSCQPVDRPGDIVSVPAQSGQIADSSTPETHLGRKTDDLIDTVDVPQRLDYVDRAESAFAAPRQAEADEPVHGRPKPALSNKANTISTLSIILTLLSIIVAFSISLIEIMGLIEENCSSCTEAAEDPEGGGLAGSWWRFWASANDVSGYIGAAIVGIFVVILAGWYGTRWIIHRRKRSGESPLLGSGLDAPQT